jgi:hypothetical protein
MDWKALRAKANISKFHLFEAVRVAIVKLIVVTLKGSENSYLK